MSVNNARRRVVPALASVGSDKKDGAPKDDDTRSDQKIPLYTRPLILAGISLVLYIAAMYWTEGMHTGPVFYKKALPSAVELRKFLKSDSCVGNDTDTCVQFLKQNIALKGENNYGRRNSMRTLAFLAIALVIGVTFGVIDVIEFGSIPAYDTGAARVLPPLVFAVFVFGLLQFMTGREKPGKEFSVNRQLVMSSFGYGTIIGLAALVVELIQRASYKVKLSDDTTA
jgi:hypothetical protein